MLVVLFSNPMLEEKHLMLETLFEPFSTKLMFLNFRGNQDFCEDTNVC